MPPGMESARRASASPTRRLRVSSSSTHGPAMRNSASRGKPPNMSVGGFDQRLSRRGCRRGTALGRGSGGNEAREQWMRARWPGAQFRMELHADEPRMILQLDDLDQRPVGRQAAESESVGDELVPIAVGDLVPVSVTLTDFGNAVDLSGARSALQAARV